MPFALKCTFAFEIHCKKHLPTSPNLEISKAFLIGLEVSLVARFFFFFFFFASRIFWPTGLGVSDLLFYRLVFRVRIFQSSRIQVIELRE